ncbi:MAG: hypothetical protein ABFS09_02060 [Thermodesulfobacteriota bacterium]
MIDASGYKPHRIPSPNWRECIKKIWEVDPLECPDCQAEMKIVSFITDNRVIRKILTYLYLWREQPSRRPPARAGPECNFQLLFKETAYNELNDEGWPGHDEPYTTYD